MQLYGLQNVYKFVDIVHRSEKAPMLLRVAPRYHYSDNGDTFAAHRRMPSASPCDRIGCY